MPTRKNFVNRKEARRETAAALLLERQKRSPKQQLELLDKRLGVGQGAVKERKRLNSINA